ncbi:transposase [Salipiger thiooxidans]|uniref:transposase n=1 Tax=Salipiger thiooxidans TaxID=282683 RepID=UPI001CD486DA|nr:transposase [Salipiger thiooxidans]
MRGEILGVERRRRWSDDQKLSIAASVGVNRATVAQVAQRHEVARPQILSWRRELKHKRLLPEDEPVRVPSLPPVQAVPSQSGAEGPAPTSWSRSCCAVSVGCAYLPVSGMQPWRA